MSQGYSNFPFLHYYVNNIFGLNLNFLLVLLRLISCFYFMDSSHGLDFYFVSAYYSCFSNYSWVWREESFTNHWPVIISPSRIKSTDTCKESVAAGKACYLQPCAPCHFSVRNSLNFFFDSLSFTSHFQLSQGIDVCSPWSSEVCIKGSSKLMTVCW